MAQRSETKREARVLIATWGVLVALTVGSFWLADSRTGSAIGSAVWLLGFAMLKSHLIAIVFMDLRRAPVAWALVMSGFLLFETAGVLAILYIGPP